MRGDETGTAKDDNAGILERALDDLLQALSDYEVDTGGCLPEPVVAAMTGAEEILEKTTGVTLEERVAAHLAGSTQ